MTFLPYLSSSGNLLLILSPSCSASCAAFLLSGCSQLPTEIRREPYRRFGWTTKPIVLVVSLIFPAIPIFFVLLRVCRFV